jgi:hypothetical protein
MNESDLNADAMAFGETRRIERLGDTEGCCGFGRKREEAEPPSSSLSNCHTVILSYCQTIKKMELFRC